MAKPNDTSNPEVTESSPRFVPLLPTSQADMCPRSATLYVDTHALPTHLLCRRWQPRPVQGENSSNPAGNGKPRAFSSRARDSARWPPAESPASSSRRGEWPASSNAR